MSRRLLTLLVALAIVGIPAGVLRAVCAGRSCPEPVTPARVPFCPLPSDLRGRIEAGFRDGRSPDVLAATREATLRGGWDYPGFEVPLWPSVQGAPDPMVPLVFAGTGIDPSAEVPAGTRLDAVAPTMAGVLGLRRPNPGVRSGVAVPGIATGDRPRLVLLVAWKGLGSTDLSDDPKAWPFLRSLMRDGAGTLGADPGSLPLDPAAVLTTIGTGGIPSQHGITGTLVRNDSGKLTEAWGAHAPLPVIAALGDDLDEVYAQRALVGMTGTKASDRGIIGGTWYLGHDEDQVVLPRDATLTASVERALADGYGADEVPDLFAVVMQGRASEMDAELRDVVYAAERAAGGSVAIAVTSTGPARPGARGTAVGRVVDQVEAAVPGRDRVIEAAVPGGLFLDQRTLTVAGISSGVVVTALRETTGPDTERLMADAFPAFAVSFARYC